MIYTNSLTFDRPRRGAREFCMFVFVYWSSILGRQLSNLYSPPPTGHCDIMNPTRPLRICICMHTKKGTTTRRAVHTGSVHISSLLFIVKIIVTVSFSLSVFSPSPRYRRFHSVLKAVRRLMNFGTRNTLCSFLGPFVTK